ncbi:glycerate kinase family protein [Candidatus Contubernalis alkaliaceticus]|uniref:glycerate kinase family protein n=1 Tax=Candidatus Contubernalis alkaliaceticus TaxID=338645 RepID=UPI001F4BD5A7|nr:glycerate kinase [Candidatus Contubernalis alkalaceticus]UNC92225.1 glycerate kinase [Candidatus Contubernalis alkalaceticus]
MRIVLAPDSFKGSLTAAQAAENMAIGIKKVLPEAQIIKLPLSDGGEGLVDSLVGSMNGEIRRELVSGPLKVPVEAYWGVSEDGKTGVIEMAAASGLTLVPQEKRNPMFTTTYGTGELIKAALKYGCTKLIIGIGGSGTNDGGMGMAQALGVKFLDKERGTLGLGGGQLIKLDHIDISGLDPTLEKASILVACDVNNPLTGTQGASAVYGPQKGADGEMVNKLDNGLKHFAKIIRRDLGVEVEHVPGAGAAGGLGAGIMAFLKGQLTPGIDLVMDMVGLEKELAHCDLVLTGEGRLDAQSVFGKVPVGVARRGRKFGVPVIALAGSIAAGAETLHREGITAYFCIIDAPISLTEAKERAAENIQRTTMEIMRLINL